MTDLILYLIAEAAFFGILFRLGQDPNAGKGPRHRAPGLPRVRRSGTTPRRRAERPDYSLAA
jgi:hypothetical protein